MNEILVIDNDDGFNQTLASTLAGPMGDAASVRSLTRVDEGDTFESSLDGVGLVLVDLELGYHGKPSLSDYDGRDKVLPRIRAAAPWIPVVLMSQHIAGDATILGQLTPCDFDGVVPKEFFETATAEGWSNFRRAVALKRIAALTGRPLRDVELSLAREVRVEFGQGVADALGGINAEVLRDLLRLLDLRCDRLVLDEVVQGFSGLAVVRASCTGNGPERQWLLKLGQVRKLWRESQAHRRMFVDGFTRHLSVPLLFWTPVSWGETGAIAYEFEKDTDTLLGASQRLGMAAALRKALPSLRELYRGSRLQRLVPRDQVWRVIRRDQVDDADIETVPLLKCLVEPEQNERLDRSVQVRVGRQHGDLHARNVLLHEDRCVLIDFTHYIPAEENGVPLMDIVKLAVDLCALLTPGLDARQVASGKALLKGPLRRLATESGAVATGGPTKDELSLFQAGACALMAMYCGYPDVSNRRKEDLRNAMRYASATGR